MKFVTIKKDSDITLDGIEIEIERQDSALKAITLRDKSGHVIVVRQESYTLYAFKPAPPELVKRYFVEGTVVGVPVSEQFEDKYAADARRDQLAANVRYDEEVKLEVVEREVPSEE